MSIVRRVAACASLGAALVSFASQAHADGLVFSPDDPAGIFVTGGGVGGAATTADGDLVTEVPIISQTIWNVSPLHLRVHAEQQTDGDNFPQPITEATFVFTVDEPVTYEISGTHVFFPAVPGTDTLGIADFILTLEDTTDDVFLFSNSLVGSAALEGSYQVGDDTGAPDVFLEGSRTGTLLPGHVYVFQVWMTTLLLNSGTPDVRAEGEFRIDVAPLDSDGDGLSDAQEAVLGSDPDVADTDGDGLLDGAEFALAAGSGCPDLLVADSDGDSLLDGAEVEAGTSPCDADSDDDGASDAIDPSPTEPGATTEQLVALAETVAAGLEATPLSEVDAPNASSAAGRLGSLVGRVEKAADAIAKGKAASAKAHLAAVRERIDGAPTPDDWLEPSAAQALLLAQVDALLALID